MRRVGILAAVLSVASAPAHAGQATCSNPGLPVGAGASADLMPGRLTLNLATGFLPVSSLETLQEPQGAVEYDSRLVLVETRLSGEYALRPWLAIGAALPYRIVDIDVLHRHPETGESVMGSTIHARTEQLRGIGDPSLLVHVATEHAGYRLHARLGTSIPLGRTEEDPFIRGATGETHQHFQLGTGTFVPLISLEAQRPLGAGIAGSAWLLALPSLYENGNGYRIGQRLSGGITASSSFGLPSVTFNAAIESHAESGERWQGIVHESEGNAGRVDVLAGGGAAWRPMKGLAIVGDIKVPVVSEFRGNQLTYPVVIGFGIVGTFDLKPRARWRGVDEAVLGAAGTAPDVTPVSGKLTVLDLWADWCPPCRELEGKLEALAARYVDRLAVRRLDVVDSESLAWTKYLTPGSYELPHIKVYGPDGRLLFEKSAAPDELIRALEAALRDRAGPVEAVRR